MKWIVYLDFLGTKPTLNVKGKTGYQTIFGGTLSIMVFVLLITGAVYFINQLLSKTNFNVIQSEEFSPNGFMDWTNTEFAITVVDRFGQQIPDAERIYSIQALWYKYDEVKNSNIFAMETKIELFNMEYCDLNKHFSNSTNLWKDEKFLSTSFCIPRDLTLNTSKTYGSTGNKGVALWLTRCSNSSIKNDCYSKEEIEYRLENVIVMTRFRNYYFDHKVNGDTGIPYIYTHTPSVSSTVYIRFWYDMQNIEYVTDDSLFLSSSTERQYSILGELKQTTDLTKDTLIPGTFATLLFNMHPMKKNVKKNYYKFQNMLADLGGLFKGVLTIASVINMYFSDKLFYNFIINQNSYSLFEQNLNQPEKNQEIKNKIYEKTTPNNNSSGFILKEENSKIEQNLNNNYVNYDVKNFKNQEEVSQSKLSKFPIVKLKVEASPSSDSKKNYSARIFKDNFKLGYDELIFPSWCLSKDSKAKKNLNIHNRLSNLIKNQFDMSSIFSRLCNIDKLEYIICGEDLFLFRTMFNPNFYNDKSIPKDSNVIHFREKNLENLSKITVS
jgi:hypothetical protein